MQDTPSVVVSVVVPTRSRPELLREALASIRALETPRLTFEILVCDNGAGEAAEPAREVGARYLLVERYGAAAARNAGLKAATGEYIAFLDDDDLWLPGHIEPQVRLLRERPEFQAAVGQTITTDEERRLTYERWPTDLPDDGELFASFLREFPQIGSTVVRSGVRESVGLLDESLLGDADWEWHLRLALAHKVGFVPVLGVLFRQRPAGSYDSLQWMRLGFMRRVLLRMLLRAGSKRPGLRECLRIIASHHGRFYWSFVESAQSHLYDDDRAAARRAIGLAFAASPVHVALGLVRDRTLQQVLVALLLGRRLTPPEDIRYDDRPLVLAPADGPALDDADGRPFTDTPVIEARR